VKRPERASVKIRLLGAPRIERGDQVVASPREAVLIEFRSIRTVPPASVEQRQENRRRAADFRLRDHSERMLAFEFRARRIHEPGEHANEPHRELARLASQPWRACTAVPEQGERRVGFQRRAAIR